MKTLYVLTEEPSIKNVFEVILPKILPQNVNFHILVHQGKNDLKKVLSEKIASLSRVEGAKILITMDQDANDCKQLKQKLSDLIGKNCNCDYKIRIVCRELESWLLGDLSAIERAFPKFKSGLYTKKPQMRNVDKTKGKPSDLLLRIIPEFKDRKNLPKIELSKKVAPFLDIVNNCSPSFNHTIKAIRQLYKDQY